MTEQRNNKMSIVTVWLPLAISFLALVISAWTAWNNYLAGPFSNATHPKLTYSAMGLNRGKIDDAHFETLLYGWVDNKGDFAAKNVSISASVYSDDVEVDVFGFSHQILNHPEGSVLFSIDLIPPKSSAVFFVKCKVPVDHPALIGVDEVPRHKAVFLGAPFVTHVYHEHGEIPEYVPPKWPHRPPSTVVLPVSSRGSDACVTKAE